VIEEKLCGQQGERIMLLIRSNAPMIDAKLLKEVGHAHLSNNPIEPLTKTMGGASFVV
jgi:hypothetical protein